MVIYLYDNCFVKFHDQNIWESMNMFYPNPCYNEVCYKGTALYYNMNR